MCIRDRCRPAPALNAPNSSCTSAGWGIPAATSRPPCRGEPQCSVGSAAPPSSKASLRTPRREYVRRPTVPPESPTLGLVHLQFEAILTAARESANRFDFALVAMLGLLGLQIFEATGTDATDLGEDHAHQV